MGLPAGLILAAGALRATSDIMSGISDAKALDAERQQNEINAQQSRYAAQQAYQEGAMAVNQTTDAARKEIASGVAGMSASGNIGTSAQAALIQGYFNLGKDVSAINYKYGNEATQHLNKARTFDYNANIIESNRKNRILSSWINAGSSIASAAFFASAMGGGGPKMVDGPHGGKAWAIGGKPMYGAS